MSNTVSSQQVSWWETHRFLESVLAKANVGALPWAGTAEWRALTDTDPRKLLSLAVAGEHHVLRIETAQQARAEASRAVAGAADWPQIGLEIRRRREVRIPREAS